MSPPPQFDELPDQCPVGHKVRQLPVYDANTGQFLGYKCVDCPAKSAFWKAWQEEDGSLCIAIGKAASPMNHPPGSGTPPTLTDEQIKQLSREMVDACGGQQKEAHHVESLIRLHCRTGWTETERETVRQLLAFEAGANSDR